MSYEIETRKESRRGCGFRQPGGKYLVAGKELAPCDRLPVPLHVCPTCHAGMKPARGWTWVDFDTIAADKPCKNGLVDGPEELQTRYLCGFCPLCSLRSQAAVDRRKKAGLLWVGEKFYATPQDFMAEAATMGLSRRIHAIPHGFKVGETLVVLAHRKAIAELLPGHDPREDGGVVWTPAIFTGFIPTAVEYVVKPTDGAEKLQRLADSGITLVKVEPILLPGTNPQDAFQGDDESETEYLLEEAKP